MGLNRKHFTHDPATGERVGLRELSIRHDRPYGCLCKRFAAGKRGWELVAPISERRAKAGEALVNRMRQLRGDCIERQQIIAELRQNPVNAAMMRPLVRKTG